MNSMTRVPTKLATSILLKAMESRSTTLAVVRLKRTSVKRNFQNPATVGTRPTSGYRIPPNTRGGTRRNGRISKRTCDKISVTNSLRQSVVEQTLDEKYVNDE